MTGKKKILLVDDDKRFLEVVTAVLRETYDVQTANNGEQAVESIGRSRPDLVVLDVMMSHMSEGFDVSRRLKSDPETQTIPIILLTGVDSVYDTRPLTEADQIVCDRYLQKPLEPRELLAAIEELLAAGTGQAGA